LTSTLPLVWKLMLADLRDARRDQVFGRRIEHREEALDDHVVELGLDLGQRLSAPAASG
jgi:hypothetical protein